MSRSLQNFAMNAGEDRTLTMTARDNGGAIIDLTGATIQWDVARSAAGGTLLTKTGSIVSASAGTFSVSLTSGETDSFTGDYWYQAKVTISGAVSIGAQGKIRFENLIGQSTVDWDIWS